MSQSASAVVKIDGSPTPLRFDACRVLLGGEFAGNVELDVSCDSGRLERVVDGLQVQLPGCAPSGPAFGSGPYPSGARLVFWSAAAGQVPTAPDEITLLWGETPIAQITPVQTDAVPIEQKVAFTEPTEILTRLPVSTSNQVLLVANRQKLWYLLAGFLFAVGALIAGSFPGLELPSPLFNWALGGSLIADGLVVAFVLAARPYRQVWLDRDRGRVLIVGGRMGDLQKKLEEAPGRALDDFDHVRVYMRWNLAEGADESDQEVWFVTLEGLIPFASEDGKVHLHDEALPIGEYSSDITARRVAAEVGFHTGLRILDTGHDQTA